MSAAAPEVHSLAEGSFTAKPILGPGLTRNSMRRLAEVAGNPTDATIAVLSRLAGELGFALSSKCMDCGATITGPISLHSRRGRVCRKKAAEAAAHKKEMDRSQQPD